MRILFISRAYPPVTGGIENHNATLAQWLPKYASVKTLANRGGKSALPLFLPLVLLQSFFLCGKYDIVLLGDGVLAPIGRILKFVYPKKKIACILHGLDITFALKKGFLANLYAWINIPSLRQLDLLITVSKETLRAAVRAGLPEEKCTVINNGVDPDTLTGNFSRKELAEFLDLNLEGKVVILRTGRYVKHKGVEWFIRNVVPRLPQNVIFVAAGAIVKKNTPGDTNAYPDCKNAVTELHLESRVKLFSDLPWKHMRLLFNTADIVVSPNIEVPGTMEGFGISIIEAAVCARPIVASDLQGIKDAVCHNENGMLVPHENADAFVRTLTELVEKEERRLALGARAKTYTEAHFHWSIISRLYVEALNKLMR